MLVYKKQVVPFSVAIYNQSGPLLDYNKQLVQQFKNLYSIDMSSANFTYNDGKEEKPLKSFWFTSNNLEDGVRVR